MEIMFRHIHKVGNSLMFVLPKKFTSEFSLHKGDTLTAVIDGNILHISGIKEKQRKINV